MQAMRDLKESSLERTFGTKFEFKRSGHQPDDIELFRFTFFCGIRQEPPRE